MVSNLANTDQEQLINKGHRLDPQHIQNPFNIHNPLNSCDPLNFHDPFRSMKMQVCKTAGVRPIHRLFMKNADGIFFMNLLCLRKKKKKKKDATVSFCWIYYLLRSQTSRDGITLPSPPLPKNYQSTQKDSD